MSRWPKYLAVERELRACWSVTREDFAGITPDVDRLWAHLSSEVVDMINQFGALQDRCRLIASSSQMGLGPEDRVFVTLRKPLANLGPGIAAFEACVQESVQVLETQHEAATLPRLKGAYRAEQERLLQRLENLKSRAAAGGRTEGDRIGGSHVH
jgi:hypothetical protein